MRARSHPVVRSDLDVEMGDTFGGNEAPPRDAAGESRLLRPEGKRAHLGVDAIGTDQQIGFGRGAVVEPGDDPLASLLDADETVAGMRAFPGHCRGKQGRKVAAMEMIVGRAEPGLDLRPESAALERAAIVPALLIDRDRAHAILFQGGAETETPQQARRVGTDLDTRADLSEQRRLFVDLDVEAGLEKAQGRRKAADPAADHRDLHPSTLLHTASPSSQAFPRHATWVSGLTRTSFAS